MSVTIGELVQSIQLRLTENADEALVKDAINDSIVDIWQALVISNLSSFLGATSAQATFGPSSDVANLVSIVDPTVAPTVAQVVAGALAQHNIAVTYTYVTDSGSETLPSPVTPVVVLVNKVAQVAPPPRIPTAIGWNVYFGAIRQNLVPLNWAQNWTENADNGPVVDGPDAPLINTTADDVWYIKSLYVTTPDGERSWDQTDIGSELWSRMANASPANSPYQSYVYDFAGQPGSNQVRVRPIPQAPVTANYFWVARPRKVKYDSGYLPFTHPSAEPYVKENSMSLISLSQHEYEASDKWAAKAGPRLASIAITNALKRTKANDRIVPFIKN